ncbi:hypothetical protein DV735_g5794, partial [Chaetothyriales sp. CBS 134920]
MSDVTPTPICVERIKLLLLRKRYCCPEYLTPAAGMALLDSHLQQISSSATAIGQLEFAPPRRFTNAVLGAHEITALIRDTEPHERSLFSLDPSLARPRPHGAHTRSGPAPPAQQSAVARVLGPKMISDIRRSTRGRGVDVTVLLDGAEKLCEAYSLPGVPEQIKAIRKHHQRIAASVAEHEEQALHLQAELDLMHVGTEEDTSQGRPTAVVRPRSTDSLEAEVAELEARKHLLEERMARTERDLGGLLA